MLYSLLTNVSNHNLHLGMYPSEWVTKLGLMELRHQDLECARLFKVIKRLPKSHLVTALNLIEQLYGKA